MAPGEIVVGRDARRSGPMVYRAVAAGLTAAGRDVADLGLATTPATEIAVETLGAAGRIILTASHNPAEWNALKFVDGRGEFIDAERGAAVRARYESEDRVWAPFDRLGERHESRAAEWHVERVMALEYLDLKRSAPGSCGSRSTGARASAASPRRDCCASWARSRSSSTASRPALSPASWSRCPNTLVV